MTAENKLADISTAFAIQILNLTENIKGHYSLSNQLERSKARMRGNLPTPVEKMLEAKHEMYDSIDCNLRLDGNYNIEDV